MPQLATGWMAKGLEFKSQWRHHFCPLHTLHTSSGAHQVSYLTGPRGTSH
jgi:hypothetical protein